MCFVVIPAETERFLIPDAAADADVWSFLFQSRAAGSQ